VRGNPPGRRGGLGASPQVNASGRPHRKSAEDRKVGGSTPPLATFDQALTCSFKLLDQYFADVYLLRTQRDVDGSDLTTALTKVADHRGVRLTPLSQASPATHRSARPVTRAWVQRRDLTDRLPQQFADLLDGAHQFADPALAGDVTGRRWAHDTLAWT
jgi:hypothetical protein